MIRPCFRLSSPLLYLILSSCSSVTGKSASTTFIPARFCTNRPASFRFMSSSPYSPNPMDGLPQPLILGSGSFTRKLILTEMGIPFHLLVRSIDERNIGNRDSDDPRDLVLLLAKAKANCLVQELSNGNIPKEELPQENSDKGYIILTGDQVVTHNGKILEKPLDIEEAKSFVSRYADSPPSTVGSVVLTHVPSGIQVSGVDTATILFRPTVADSNDNGLDLVDALLQDDAPVLRCAGGLMVEHPLVQEHVERIDGTQDSVMGLSKDLVLELLDEMKGKLQNASVVSS